MSERLPTALTFEDLLVHVKGDARPLGTAARVHPTGDEALHDIASALDRMEATVDASVDAQDGSTSAC